MHSRPSTTPIESKPEEKIVPIAPPADSVASRLGLEPETAAEERIQRPRFLDINEPAKESRPAASSGTASIVGPSFLGLSDAPLIAAEGVSQETTVEEDAPRRGNWRVWAAVAIILLFAVLGIVQWRAQATQSGTGPLQIIKAKLDSWRHGSSKPADTEQGATSTPSTTANSQPEIQAAQQPAPQVPAPAANTPAATPSVTNTTTSKPGSSSSPSTQSSTVAPKPPAAANSQSPPTVTNSASAPLPDKQPPSSTSTGSGETASPGSQPAPVSADNNAAKPARRSDTTQTQAAASGAGAPGADEMLKAKNASDSTAAAAWLWKATAKGNPEAPVQLADMYIKGNGVPRSCEQAVVLLKTAAEKENALARNRLASMYATGNCVSRNRVEAYRWLSAALAANPGSQWAQQNRDLIWSQMTPDEQAAAQKYR